MRPLSVCVFCGASSDVEPSHLSAADQLGRQLAAAGLRLVYGGGVVGLMGAAAKAAHQEGGQVLGIIPAFLTEREQLFDAVPTEIVDDMHQRKRRMFEESDAFLVLPGGMGTLEEVVEVLSWRRLELHSKPVLFVSPQGYWDDLLKFIDHAVATGFAPAWMTGAFSCVDDVGAAVTAMLDLLDEEIPTTAGAGARLEDVV